MTVKKIAIIGGGTAGWMAANHLGFELRLDPEIEITVIESPDIPTIGVGEGTVPYIRKALEKFGISEADLIANCDATFKQGIKFVEWLDPAVHGKDHYYYHPFDTPFPAGRDVTRYWLANREKFEFHHVSAQAGVCDAMRAPKRISSLPYQGELGYAYHFDALKFAQLLAKNALEKFSIKHKKATIRDAEQCSDGSVKNLLFDTGEIQAFDFYVDCSGFSSFIIDQKLKVPFVDCSDQVLTDTVLALQVPTDGQAEIPPYTIAKAHSAGWLWDIALPNRRGLGFVYSSSYMSEEKALTDFGLYLGLGPETLSPRKIPIKVGYREEPWRKNCVAIGLAQGFVEPLEATSILLTDFSAEYLAKTFPKNQDDMPLLAKRYNKTLTYSWDRTIDFVKLHYCLSDRSDSDFWRANCNPDTFSQTLRERLQLWRIEPPKKQDFFSRFEVFDVENYLYVLYGMRFFTPPSFLSEFEARDSQEQIDKISEQSKRLQGGLLSHREWLTKLKQAMRNV
ncbi:tryptophan halogenase family protein [uncultured Gilvimarinus sp.]|uniref:tryptophan halogenase family protein n=1 Tax=uncultured Gilvimarinus sp. TaxID=1689143 RepID=UPI0030EF6AE0